MNEVACRLAEIMQGAASQYLIDSGVDTSHIELSECFRDDAGELTHDMVVHSVLALLMAEAIIGMAIEDMPQTFMPLLSREVAVDLARMSYETAFSVGIMRVAM
jgi:hypothetical protein